MGIPKPLKSIGKAGAGKMPQSNPVKQIIFLGVVVLLIALVFVAIQYQDVIIKNLLWLAIGTIFIYLIVKYDYVLLLKEYERAVILRFGRVNRVGGPGWAVQFPPLEESIVVELRTQTIDVPKQSIITKDKIELTIDAVIYMRVKKDNASVINSVTEVKDYQNAMQLYVISLIRDVAGSLQLSELVENIEKLNVQLKEGLKEVSEQWGVEVISVEIQSVDIPKIVLDALHDKQAAEQRKLGRFEEAEAQKREIEVVKEAAESLSDKALAYYYVKALEKLAEGKATKIIFPLEITKIAEAIGGRAVGKNPSELETIFRKYRPVIQSYIDEQEKKEKKKSQ